MFVSVWIPDGVKTVRGGICNPFSKGDDVSKHWQAACRHWQFAYVQVDFDAVKKEEFALLKTGLTDLAKQTKHPELEHLPLCFTGMSRRRDEHATRRTHARTHHRQRPGVPGGRPPPNLPAASR